MLVPNQPSTVPSGSSELVQGPTIVPLTDQLYPTNPLIKQVMDPNSPPLYDPMGNLAAIRDQELAKQAAAAEAAQRQNAMAQAIAQAQAQQQKMMQELAAAAQARKDEAAARAAEAEANKPPGGWDPIGAIGNSLKQTKGVARYIGAVGKSMANVLFDNEQWNKNLDKLAAETGKDRSNLGLQVAAGAGDMLKDVGQDFAEAAAFRKERNLNLDWTSASGIMNNITGFITDLIGGGILNAGVKKGVKAGLMRAGLDASEEAVENVVRGSMTKKAGMAMLTAQPAVLHAMGAKADGMKEQGASDAEISMALAPMYAYESILFALPVAVRGKVLKRMLSGGAIGGVSAVADTALYNATVDDKYEMDPLDAAVPGAVLGAMFGGFFGQRPGAGRTRGDAAAGAGEPRPVTPVTPIPDPGTDIVPFGGRTSNELVPRGEDLGTVYGETVSNGEYTNPLSGWGAVKNQKDQWTVQTAAANIVNSVKLAAQGLVAREANGAPRVVNGKQVPLTIDESIILQDPDYLLQLLASAGRQDSKGYRALAEFSENVFKPAVKRGVDEHDMRATISDYAAKNWRRQYDESDTLAFSKSMGWDVNDLYGLIDAIADGKITAFAEVGPSKYMEPRIMEAARAIEGDRWARQNVRGPAGPGMPFDPGIRTADQQVAQRQADNDAREQRSMEAGQRYARQQQGSVVGYQNGATVEGMQRRAARIQGRAKAAEARELARIENETAVETETLNRMLDDPAMQEIVAKRMAFIDQHAETLQLLEQMEKDAAFLSPDAPMTAQFKALHKKVGDAFEAEMKQLNAAQMIAAIDFRRENSTIDASVFDDMIEIVQSIAVRNNARRNPNTSNSPAAVKTNEQIVDEALADADAAETAGGGITEVGVASPGDGQASSMEVSDALDNVNQIRNQQAEAGITQQGDGAVAIAGTGDGAAADDAQVDARVVIPKPGEETAEQIATRIASFSKQPTGELLKFAQKNPEVVDYDKLDGDHEFQIESAEAGGQILASHSTIRALLADARGLIDKSRSAAASKAADDGDVAATGDGDAAATGDGDAAATGDGEAGNTEKNPLADIAEQEDAKLRESRVRSNTYGRTGYQQQRVKDFREEVLYGKERPIERSSGKYGQHFANHRFPADATPEKMTGWLNDLAFGMSTFGFTARTKLEKVQFDEDGIKRDMWRIGLSDRTGKRTRGMYGNLELAVASDNGKPVVYFYHKKRGRLPGSGLVSGVPSIKEAVQQIMTRIATNPVYYMPTRREEDEDGNIIITPIPDDQRQASQFSDATLAANLAKAKKGADSIPNTVIVTQVGERTDLQEGNNLVRARGKVRASGDRRGHLIPTREYTPAQYSKVEPLTPQQVQDISDAYNEVSVNELLAAKRRLRLAPIKFEPATAGEEAYYASLRGTGYAGKKGPPPKPFWTLSIEPLKAVSQSQVINESKLLEINPEVKDLLAKLTPDERRVYNQMGDVEKSLVLMRPHEREAFVSELSAIAEDSKGTWAAAKDWDAKREMEAAEKDDEAKRKLVAQLEENHKKARQVLKDRLEKESAERAAKLKRDQAAEKRRKTTEAKKKARLAELKAAAKQGDEDAKTELKKLKDKQERELKKAQREAEEAKARRVLSTNRSRAVDAAYKAAGAAIKRASATEMQILGEQNENLTAGIVSLMREIEQIDKLIVNQKDTSWKVEALELMRAVAEARVTLFVERLNKNQSHVDASADTISKPLTPRTPLKVSEEEVVRDLLDELADITKSGDTEAFKDLMNLVKELTPEQRASFDRSKKDVIAENQPLRSGGVTKAEAVKSGAQEPAPTEKKTRSRKPKEEAPVEAPVAEADPLRATQTVSAATANANAQTEADIKEALWAEKSSALDGMDFSYLINGGLKSAESPQGKPDAALEEYVRIISDESLPATARLSQLGDMGAVDGGLAQRLVSTIDQFGGAPAVRIVSEPIGGMRYYPETDEIHVDPSYYEDKAGASMPTDYMHEMGHAATAHAIEAVRRGLAPPEIVAAVERLDQIRASLADNMRPMDPNDPLAALSSTEQGMYWNTDVDEFVAEAWSNPDFQTVLRGMDGAWDEVVGANAEAINASDMRSLLEEVMDLSERIAGWSRGAAQDPFARGAVAGGTGSRNAPRRGGAKGGGGGGKKPPNDPPPSSAGPADPFDGAGRDDWNARTERFNRAQDERRPIDEPEPEAPASEKEQKANAKEERRQAAQERAEDVTRRYHAKRNNPDGSVDEAEVHWVDDGSVYVSETSGAVNKFANVQEAINYAASQGYTVEGASRSGKQAAQAAKLYASEYAREKAAASPVTLRLAEAVHKALFLLPDATRDMVARQFLRASAWVQQNYVSQLTWADRQMQLFRDAGVELPRDIATALRNASNRAGALAQTRQGTPTAVALQEINAILKSDPSVSVDDLAMFMAAQHVEHYNKRHAEGRTRRGSSVKMPDDVSGFEHNGEKGTAAARKYMESFSVEQRTTLEAASARYQDLHQYALQEARRSGLLSEAQYRKLGGRLSDGTIEEGAPQFYVPFKNAESAGISPVARFSKGRTTAPANVLTVGMADITKMLQQVHRNDALNELVNALELYPSSMFRMTAQDAKLYPDFDLTKRAYKGETLADVSWTTRDPKGDTSLYAFRDGKVIRLTAIDKGAARYIEGLHKSQQADFLHYMSHLTRMYGLMKTGANPAFLAYAPVWDAFSVMTNMEAAARGKMTTAQANATAKQALRYGADSLVSLLKRETKGAVDDPYLQIYGRDGGGVSPGSRIGFSEMEDAMRQQAGLYTGEASRFAKLNDVKKRGLGILHTAEDVFRFSTFKASIEQLAGRKFTDTAALDAWAKENPSLYDTALDMSRSVIGDFADRGSSQVMSSMFIFFNPAVQGSRMMMRSLMTPQGKKMWSMMVAAGAVSAFTGMEAFGDDKDGVAKYARMRGRERIATFGGNFGVPIAPELRIPYMVGNGLALLMRGKQDAAAAALDVSKAAVGSMYPLQAPDLDAPVSSWTYSLAPSLATIPLLMLNETNQFGRPQQTDVGKTYGYDKNGKQIRISNPANWERKMNNTDQKWATMAESLYDATNGTVDLYPTRLRETAKTALGGMYNVLAAGLDPEKQMENLTRGYTTKYDSYEVKEDYEKAKTRAAALARSRGTARNPLMSGGKLRDNSTPKLFTDADKKAGKVTGPNGESLNKLHELKRNAERSNNRILADGYQRQIDLVYSMQADIYAEALQLSGE